MRLVSPSSPPEPESVLYQVQVLESLGLRVDQGNHVLSRHGYLAGTDLQRLSDLNDAIRHPEVRAIIATRGGKGAFRIVDGVDFSALRDDPKLLIGFSENTILHLGFWLHAGMPGIHGACWGVERAGRTSAESFRKALLTADPIVIDARHDEPTRALTTGGRAQGRLLGGNLDMIAAAAGWMLPKLAGAILLIEDIGKGLGHIDRHLHRLRMSGSLDGIQGIAVGRFTDFAMSDGFSILDVLRDNLDPLGVPILGGLPIGHGANAVAVPIGSDAILDADNGTLIVEPCVG